MKNYISRMEVFSRKLFSYRIVEVISMDEDINLYETYDSHLEWQNTLAVIRLVDRPN